MGPTEKIALQKLADGQILTTDQLAALVWPSRLPIEPHKCAANIVARLRRRGYNIATVRGYVLEER
jgi:hypothetical protein